MVRGFRVAFVGEGARHPNRYCSVRRAGGSADDGRATVSVLKREGLKAQGTGPVLASSRLLKRLKITNNKTQITNKSQ